MVRDVSSWDGSQNRNRTFCDKAHILRRFIQWLACRQSKSHSPRQRSTFLIISSVMSPRRLHVLRSGGGGGVRGPAYDTTQLQQLFAELVSKKTRRRSSPNQASRLVLHVSEAPELTVVNSAVSGLNPQIGAIAGAWRP